MSDALSSRIGWDGRPVPSYARILREYRRSLALTVGLFVVGLFGGAAATAVIPPSEGTDRIASTLPDPTVPGLLVNNTVVLALLVVGACTLGLLSAAIVLFNAGIVGYFAAVAVTENGPLVAAVAFLPHGIPEFAAFFFGCAVPLRFAGQLIAHLRGRRGTVVTRAELRDAAALLVLAQALLVVAAVVEIHVTVPLIEAVDG